MSAPAGWNPAGANNAAPRQEQLTMWRDVNTHPTRESSKVAHKLAPASHSAAALKLPVQGPMPAAGLCGFVYPYVVDEPLPSAELRGRRMRRQLSQMRQAAAKKREAPANLEASDKAFHERQLARLSAGERADLAARMEVCKYGQVLTEPVRVMARTIMRDVEPGSVQVWLDRVRDRYSPTVAGMIAEAALCPNGAGGYRFGWHKLGPRRVVVGMIATLMLAREVPGRDGGELCVRGIPRGALRELMRDAGGQAPSPEWISSYASQYGRRELARGNLPAERPLHHLGFLKRCVRVGFMRKVQLPARAATVEAFEVRPDRRGVPRCINRYYLRWRQWEAQASTAALDALTELARVACEHFIRAAPRTIADRRDAEARARASAPD